MKAKAGRRRTFVVTEQHQCGLSQRVGAGPHQPARNRCHGTSAVAEQQQEGLSQRVGAGPQQPVRNRRHRTSTVAERSICFGNTEVGGQAATQGTVYEVVREMQIKWLSRSKERLRQTGPCSFTLRCRGECCRISCSG